MKPLKRSKVLHFSVLVGEGCRLTSSSSPKLVKGNRSISDGFSQFGFSRINHVFNCLWVIYGVVSMVSYIVFISLHIFLTSFPPFLRFNKIF